MTNHTIYGGGVMTTTSVQSVRSVADAVNAFRFTWRDEVELQEGIDHVLTDAGLAPEREVRLDGASRIDFLVGRIGIEVKIKGTATAVARQLQRYAHSDRIDELVLVTSSVRHSNLPDRIGGVPLTVVVLGGGL